MHVWTTHNTKERQAQWPDTCANDCSRLSREQNEELDAKPMAIGKRTRWKDKSETCFGDTLGRSHVVLAAALAPLVPWPVPSRIERTTRERTGGSSRSLTSNQFPPGRSCWTSEDTLIAWHDTVVDSVRARRLPTCRTDDHNRAAGTRLRPRRVHAQKEGSLGVGSGAMVGKRAAAMAVGVTSITWRTRPT